VLAHLIPQLTYQSLTVHCHWKLTQNWHTPFLPSKYLNCHNGGRYSKKLLSAKQQKNILDQVLPNQVYRNMKTVTIKADAEFDALLSRLARRMSTTKSRVIRDAVRNYQQHLDREALRQQMRNASLKTRNQALDASDDFDAANADGL